MSEVGRRWGKRLLWVLPVLLAIYCIGNLADFVWFRSQVPIGFQNANWSGSWQTEQYGSLSGRLLVRLPDPLPEAQGFRAEALVYYPIYSVWKTGQFVKMDFAGQFSPDAPTSAGQSTNSIPSGGGKLKFQGVAGDQVVEYVAILDPTRTKIVGGYRSRSPSDYGYFTIRYY